MRNKIIKWATSIFAITLILVGSYHLLKDRRFNTDAPIATLAPPADLAEARDQDVSHLALFFELEKSFTPATLANAKALYDDLRHEAKTMTDAQFDLAVARIVAAADNAHSKVREYGRTPRFNRLPVRGHWFADGFYIIRAHQGFEHLLGRKVIAIDGLDFADAAAAIREYVAGNDGTFRKYAPYFLESPELMHAIGLARSPDAISLTLQDAEGRIETVTLDEPFPPSEEHIARSHQLLSPKVYRKSQSDWIPAPFNQAQTPLYLQTPIEQLQKAFLPETNAYYVQFWSNNDIGDISITSFCQDALRDYQASSAKTLIVDHRFNGGGNNRKTSDCMEDFAKTAKHRGRLYIIIGGPTFSAGVYSVATLKHHGGEKAYLVGDAVGGRLKAWAEDNLLRLPNSEIEIKFSTGFHDLQDGCTDWSRCEWGSMYHPLRFKSLAPDILAPLRFDDYINGRDPAMLAIQAFEATRGG